MVFNYRRQIIGVSAGIHVIKSCDRNGQLNVFQIMQANQNCVIDGMTQQKQRNSMIIASFTTQFVSLIQSPVFIFGNRKIQIKKGKQRSLVTISNNKRTIKIIKSKNNVT